jgi:hypothetical protein
MQSGATVEIAGVVAPTDIGFSFEVSGSEGWLSLSSHHPYTPFTMPVSSRLWRAPQTGACARNWARIAVAALNKEIAEGAEPTVSDRGHAAAIDREVHACDEACFVRSEEQGGRCDLVRTA